MCSQGMPQASRQGTMRQSPRGKAVLCSRQAGQEVHTTRPLFIHVLQVMPQTPEWRGIDSVQPTGRCILAHEVARPCLLTSAGMWAGVPFVCSFIRRCVTAWGLFSRAISCSRGPSISTNRSRFRVRHTRRVMASTLAALQ